jgi:hypothetical protein
LTSDTTPHSSAERTKLSKLYDVEEDNEDDLNSQFEQITAFEAAADSGDWNQFKQVVNESGQIFLKSMRTSDEDPRRRLPLFQSGELEERFKNSLNKLNRDWASLLPWWARFGHRFQILLTLVSTGLAMGAIRAAVTGTPGLGAFLGGIAVALLVLVDNSEPRLGGKSRWWVRLVSPKRSAIFSKLRILVYVVAITFISWGALAGTFKTPPEYCEDLDPANIASQSSCEDGSGSRSDPFAMP